MPRRVARPSHIEHRHPFITPHVIEVAQSYTAFQRCQDTWPPALMEEMPTLIPIARSSPLLIARFAVNCATRPAFSYENRYPGARPRRPVAKGAN
jgi:hypothetical protein